MEIQPKFVGLKAAYLLADAFYIIRVKANPAKGQIPLYGLPVTIILP